MSDPKAQMQEEYMKLQIIKQQLTELLEHKSGLDQKLQEIIITETMLEKLSTEDEEKPMWTPIGTGVYLDTQLKKSKILMEIGQSIFIKKSKKEALEMVKSKKSEIEELNEQLLKQMQAFNEEAEKVENKLTALSEKIQ